MNNAERVKPLDRELLMSLVEYLPDTGAFKWRVSRGGVMAGSYAGTLSKKGYIKIKINGRGFSAHRLAWCLCFGDTKDEIDHIDGDKTNNRIGNLRALSHQTNTENLRVGRPGTSTGLLGVTTRRGKFIAQIITSGVKFHLGTFPTPEQAHLVYVEAKRRLHLGCTI